MSKEKIDNALFNLRKAIENLKDSVNRNDKDDVNKEQLHKNLADNFKNVDKNILKTDLEEIRNDLFETKKVIENLLNKKEEQNK